jgi:hypothetical protein
MHQKLQHQKNMNSAHKLFLFIYVWCSVFHNDHQNKVCLFP